MSFIEVTLQINRRYLPLHLQTAIAKLTMFGPHVESDESFCNSQSATAWKQRAEFCSATKEEMKHQELMLFVCYPFHTAMLQSIEVLEDLRSL